MKPTDLFNAIENIPDKYIDAAKPSSVKRHGESRSVVQKSVRDAEAVSSKTSSLSDARHTHSRKDNIRMSTKQPVLQRIATAFAAAAACVVFAGGGLFIVQQARQNHQEPENSGVETSLNFLGGSGEIRSTDDMFMMYDDRKFYFQFAQYEAMRTGSEIDTLKMGTHLSDILYDGEQFYRKEGAEGTSLYRIDAQGKHMDEKPFYTIDTDAISAQLGSECSAPMYHAVRKLADGYYYICYSAVINDDQTGDWQSKDYNIIYQPATGQQDEIPNGSTAAPQTVEENGIIFNMPTPRMITDGKDIIFAEYDGSMYRVTLDPVKIELYEPAPKTGSYMLDWMIADGSVYFMNGTGEASDEAPYSYGKIDLDSHTYTEILHETDFSRFYPCDGRIFALTDDNTKLVCADPDWTNVETVCDFRSGMTEAFTKALNETCGGDLTNAYVTAADENYILVCFVFGDPGKSCAVIDRKTGAARFFRAPETEEYTPENTAETTPENTAETTPETTAETTAETTPENTRENTAEPNIFGGLGELTPVDWDVRGAVALYRDNSNYYYFESSNDDFTGGGKWYRCPITGGQKEQLPARINGAQAPSQPLISDGERVFTPYFSVVSEGNAANRFDTTEVQNYLNALNNDETDNGYYYSCSYIWHIRDRYFILITGTNAANDIINTEVWTDNSGRIISHDTAAAGITSYFCSGNQREMCMIKDGLLDIIDCPGDEPDDKPDPLAYGKIKDLYYDMDGSFFLDENHDIYTFDSHGEKALVTDVPYNEPLLMPAPDGRFFYVNMERLNFSLREWKESETYDPEIYAPENSNSQELWICGYEQTGNGSYNLVLKRTYDDYKTGFVFVDPTTGQTVKRIQ